MEKRLEGMTKKMRLEGMAKGMIKVVDKFDEESWIEFSSKVVKAEVGDDEFTEDTELEGIHIR